MNNNVYILFFKIDFYCFCSLSAIKPLQTISNPQCICTFQIMSDHFRTLEKELKELRILEGEGMEGQRASRAAKWMASSKNVREEAGLDNPETLQTLVFS